MSIRKYNNKIRELVVVGIVLAVVGLVSFILLLVFHAKWWLVLISIVPFIVGVFLLILGLKNLPNKTKKEELNVYKVEVKGMGCGMCEAHINDLIRKNFNVKSVKSNKNKNLTIIKSVDELDIAKIRETISKEGYEVGNIEK